MIVCLVIVGLICGALVRLGLAERRQVRMEERRLQAEWLAESGLERASSRLAGDADYKGETWQVAAEAIGGAEGGLVTIEVGRVEGHPDRRRVRVRADYPRDPTQRARHSKQIEVGLNPERPGGGR